MELIRIYFTLLFHSNVDDCSGKSRVSSFNVELFFSMMMKLSMFCANIARAVESEMNEFHNISDPYESIFNINFKD